MYGDDKPLWLEVDVRLFVQRIFLMEVPFIIVMFIKRFWHWAQKESGGLLKCAQINSISFVILKKNYTVIYTKGKDSEQNLGCDPIVSFIMLTYFFIANRVFVIEIHLDASPPTKNEHTVDLLYCQCQLSNRKLPNCAIAGFITPHHWRASKSCLIMELALKFNVVKNHI